MKRESWLARSSTIFNHLTTYALAFSFRPRLRRTRKPHEILNPTTSSNGIGSESDSKAGFAAEKMGKGDGRDRGGQASLGTDHYET